MKSEYSKILDESDDIDESPTIIMKDNSFKSNLKEE